MADEYLQAAGAYPEQTALEFKLKVDEIDLAVHQFRQIHDRFREMQDRFSQMTEETAELLGHWTRLDQQHATVIAALNDRLSDWSGLERRLLAESADRIKTFERGVEHEWTALRHLHEGPVRKLEQHETSLRERVLEMVKVAMASVQVAENRFASHANQVEGRLSEFARASVGQHAQWTDELEEHRRGWRRVGIATLVGALLLGASSVWLHTRMGGLEASLQDISARTLTADRQERNDRDALAHDVAAARTAAAQAVRVSAILAAPDLRQVDLIGQSPAPKATGRLLWSRSRGLVIDATGLPPLVEGTSYRAWILTAGSPVSAGTLTPDPQGDVTAVLEAPPPQTRLAGAMVTLEPRPEATAPAGEVYLSSAPSP